MLQVATAVASAVHEHLESELFASLMAKCLDGLEACLTEAKESPLPGTNGHVSFGPMQEWHLCSLARPQQSTSSAATSVAGVVIVKCTYLFPAPS